MVDAVGLRTTQIYNLNTATAFQIKKQGKNLYSIKVDDFLNSKNWEWPAGHLYKAISLITDHDTLSKEDLKGYFSDKAVTSGILPHNEIAEVIKKLAQQLNNREQEAIARIAKNNGIIVTRKYIAEEIERTESFPGGGRIWIYPDQSSILNLLKSVRAREANYSSESPYEVSKKAAIIDTLDNMLNVVSNMDNIGGIKYQLSFPKGELKYYQDSAETAKNDAYRIQEHTKSVNLVAAWLRNSENW